jgi:SAM-dependent methyltransferase
MALILNLGSGVKVSSDPDVVNVDWSPYLRIARSRVLRKLSPLLLDRERLNRLHTLPDNVLVHNLKEGIPWPDCSVDVVYHSHLLEHLDRDVAERFMLEIRRVLRPGGIQRIVVPDLEKAVLAYLDNLRKNPEADGDKARDSAPHDKYVAAILEQSIRRESSGTSTKRPLRRALENLLLGDARRRGETHQWMYDALNLSQLLERCGFADIERRSFDSSGIPNWQRYGFDRNDDGSEYKPESLYMEASRPS